ncbi:MAG: D-alanyl-D-alanine carboxypeptidase [Spirochaetaceae bacterium]|nr:D-alanyl-D-alanine carboxypeptidase [Spirochaetaceae bacterium]MCF7948269.1 D-alanyl-D-alanine carboxypeptidase [Spirochaetia bacterium]MCF7952061.1 D-alanyl-D-alanine carboxypeptidase [Spirochaetaceae bacterium]
MSKAAAVYDYETSTLLYEKNGDIRIPPASMTKLMTLHLTFKAIEEGRIKLDSRIEVEAGDDFSNMPRRSSLMFIEKGQEVSVLQLMRGLAVPSGNDAAHMLARVVSGSVEKFVEAMNREAEKMGFDNIHFRDPAGLNAQSYVTAKEFGLFCLDYIRSHPESLELLHSQKEFTYPTDKILQDGAQSSYGPITQENYNILIGRHPWVDGLKTGYIDESGYNIALSAMAGDRRVVAVILGGPGENIREGAFTRAIDGVNLLSYGFYHFTRVEPEFPSLPELRVWKGSRNTVHAQLHAPEVLVLPLDVAAVLEVRHELDLPLSAPLMGGEEIGRTLITSGQKLIRSYPILIKEPVEEGSWWQQLRDSILQLR